ncbi:MAG: hypothetical protein IJO89_02140 [Clostridia bacterium]|nr:hypothetical protein [Clostridia bacterium]MBQ5717504.1 hypothetical protein [Clostridia bacterium]MBQ9957828.1 hypothetical protein [Clostridia bacterium]
MNDIVSQLSSFIESEEGMNTVKGLAESLMSGDSDISSLLSSIVPDVSSSIPPPQKKEEKVDTSLPISPDQLSSIMQIMRAFNSSSDDSRTRLLLALKPHLSEKRRERVDKAIKIMKLLAIMPMITESGIFKL